MVVLDYVKCSYSKIVIRCLHPYVRGQGRKKCIQGHHILEFPVIKMV